MLVLSFFPFFSSTTTTLATMYVMCYTQVHVHIIILKVCVLKGGNIGIVEKAQETRFGMSPKYSRIASWNHVLCPM